MKRCDKIEDCDCGEDEIDCSEYIILLKVYFVFINKLQTAEKCVVNFMQSFLVPKNFI